ncbi:MAG TPA: lipoyl(octanoyl) transferase LipB [Gaiellales bacterium]|jgi:lipoyl(octanoyl) transferase|nr:lipoyl(octanoyl) transferase LipB [Gaiellales bacterium]
MAGAYLYDLHGLTPYADALRLQQELAAARSQQAIPDTVVLLEHEPVITLGSRAVRAEELPLAADEYAARGIEIVEVPRGGRSTYHGPGQLVCYPILDLNDRGRDLRRHVRGLEQTIVRTLAGFGIAGSGRDEPHQSGVWVDDRKIASIGVRCARWVTSHGLAVNVDLDLGVYELFDACGLGKARFTSIAAEAGRPVTTDEVRGPLLDALCEAFGLELETVPAEDHALV